MKKVIKALIISTFLSLYVNNVRADQPYETVEMLNITLGQTGILDDLDEPVRLGVEYRFKSFGQRDLIPSIGLAGTETGAYFLYSDIRHDFWLNDRWLLIPSFGVGIFDDSEEIQLGSKLEFRSGIELAYRFYKQYRFGLALFHLSNGGIADKNPGTETLVFSLCIPME